MMEKYLILFFLITIPNAIVILFLFLRRIKRIERNNKWWIAAYASVLILCTGGLYFGFLAEHAPTILR